MSAPVEPTLPFRWDLITPDHFGTLLDGMAKPDLWYAAELLECAGKVIARSGDGDLFFVGRSLDSMFDLLGGAFEQTAWKSRLHRLPLSFAVSGRRVGHRWRPGRVTHPQLQAAKEILHRLGLSPYQLARRKRPATFVDVVHGGGTFTDLFGLLRAWIGQTREPWSVIRQKLIFVGVTSRLRTSPKAYRWQQHAKWTRSLPARSVLNVSLDPVVWSYFGDRQAKLTHTFRPQAWLGQAHGPLHDGRTVAALAEAAALVELGRGREARRALVQAMAADPAIAQPWLRALIVQL